MATYGTEHFTGATTFSGANQACDRVWLSHFSASACYLLIADSGPASDANLHLAGGGKIYGPFAVTNTNKIHLKIPTSGSHFFLMWMVD